MNKNDFIEKLEDKTQLTKDKCIKINDIIESTSIIGKTNKEEIIDKIKTQLDVDDKQADTIYNASMEILKDGLVDKIKHPFNK